MWTITSHGEALAMNEFKSGRGERGEERGRDAEEGPLSTVKGKRRIPLP